MVLVKVPGEQLTQVDGDEAPITLEYVPTAQLIQELEPDDVPYCPAEQLVHKLDPMTLA